MIAGIWNPDWPGRAPVSHDHMMDTGSNGARERIFIVGAGAVGLPLAAALAAAGREVVLVRARPDGPRIDSNISVRFGGNADPVSVRVEQVSFHELRELDGTVVLAIKSHANEEVAAALASKKVRGELVVMQNGLGVEQPFLSCGFEAMLRSVLYMTSQVRSDGVVEFRQIASCPIGTVAGEPSRLAGCVAALTTPLFAFHGHDDIETEAWRKTIVNAAFNSICPLLEADNGLFARDAEAAAVARRIAGECVALARDRGLSIREEDVMSRIMEISRGSDGVMISTLQDILAGRETEVTSLNLAIARIGAESVPPHVLPVTEALGQLVLAKSRLTRR
ncbi:NAD(P)-binding domain-containing protein [Luteolibacter arcticus]|uniref:2-dehydropantoate 2-reductase n=1 Tax=Luteolibacter arcticus TaxID=1581411 RepID=A0ABT3GQS6_9BACT|nr:ketopantoate reductase C-terminal domain-containing protein [Luteolibacter arcticus]MCW1925862.1 NAD(P)-binding domain-containing protein [Luteolibacter arcticus]